MNTKQRFFTDRTMLLMLALLSAFPPISTDLYLPALPNMVQVMNASQSLVNLTLSLFLLFFSLGILIWGPISEKYGRKPILLIGLAIYTLAGIGCALSTTVYQLIAGRIMQAAGGGAATAVATAMVKDMYSGRKREAVLAVVMAMVIVAPIVAPLLGAMLLKIADWRMIFWMLGGVGALVFSLALLLDETLEEKYTGSLAGSLLRLGVVIKNPGFSTLLGIFSLVPLPMLAFVASSSFIYIRWFGMSEQSFSYFFAFNAMGAICGPLLYIRISRWINARKLIVVCFGIIMVCGLFLTAAGSRSPFFFALSMAVATMSMSMIRPPTANLMLAQQQKDAGSASSLINFTGMLMGSTGMFLISLKSGNQIPVLGLMQAVMGAVCGGLWLLVRNKSFIRQEN